MKKLVLAAALFSVGVAAQAAPLVSVYGGAYSWHTKTSGDIGDSDANTAVKKVDMEDDLNFGKKGNTVWLLGVEHKVPIIPNARLSHVDLKDSGHGQLSASIDIDGKSFAKNAAVNSSYDLDMTDLTLYYTPWKTIVKVDVGLNIRRIDAEFKVDDGVHQAKLSTTKTIPMGFAGVSGKLPYGFYAGTEVNAIGYSGNQFSDTTAKVGWRSPYLLGVEGGYRAMKLKLDDVGSIDSDIDFKGPYVSLTLSF